VKNFILKVFDWIKTRFFREEYRGMNVVGQGILLNPINFYMFYCMDEHDNEKGGIIRIVLFSNYSAF